MGKMKMKLLILLAASAVCVLTKSLKDAVAEDSKGPHQCEYNGHTYQEGDYLPTRHLCLSCICKIDFLEPNSHDCQVIECPITNYIELGCIPEYNDTDCCPVDWDCDSKQAIKEKCDKRYFNHYAAKGCTPVYEGESECPVRFQCPTKVEHDHTKCEFKARLYEKGDEIVTSNPCLKCYCQKDWIQEGEVKIDCISIECPSAFRRLEENCYEVYEEDTCCSSRKQCTSDAVDFKSAQEKTCVHGGRTYRLGERIYPEEEPCLVCRCTEDWIGIFGNSCRVLDCSTLDLKKKQLNEGCIPIYHEATCCPIEFHCPIPNQLKSENGTLLIQEIGDLNPEQSCSYKGILYPLGHLLDIQHPTNCVVCNCTTPPDFTCIHRQCPGPPKNDYENCQSTYNPGECCETYQCRRSVAAIPTCAPVSCPAGCKEMTVQNSCPFCSCSGKLCSVPKCGDGCILDTEVPEGECFRCKCADPEELACSPVKCPSHCHEVVNPEGCPVCVCGPLCSPPKCIPGCQVKRDVGESECPACLCPDTSGSLDLVDCSPVKCGPACHEGESQISGCPICICEPFCTPPKCAQGCHLQTDIMPRSCPECVCPDVEGLVLAAVVPVPLCSTVKCGPLCHKAFEGNGCPACICDVSCSLPKCGPGCHLNYDQESGPCPHCKCEDQQTDGSSPIQCSPPKCEEGFQVDYSSKPCPSCTFTGSSSIPLLQCSPPKCEEGCRVNFSSKPCPSCDCGTDKRLPTIMCSPPKCEDGCHIDYSTKPCSSCKCDSSSIPNILCSPPKCDPGCQIDYNSRPCPSCTCGGTRTGIPDIFCSPPKCEEGCRVDYSNKPCPSCKCGSNSDIPPLLCSPPKCDDPGCSVDYSTKPCPSCSCKVIGPPAIHCSPPNCGLGCTIDYGTKPCPSCNCSEESPQCSLVKCPTNCREVTSSNGCPDCQCVPSCSIPKCQADCWIDFLARPCPTCLCDTQQSKASTLQHQLNVFLDPYCSKLKCGPGCEWASVPASPNERCPGCICRGAAGERKTCGAMQCELPCRFERFSQHGCPICLCHPIPCPRCPDDRTEEKEPGERCPRCIPLNQGA